MKKLMTNKQALTGFIIIGSIVVLALFAPYITPQDPHAQNIYNRYVDPEGLGGDFILGTDHLGRDIFSRIILGTRISLMVGLISVGLSVAAGVFLGAVAGYAGGFVDEIIMRIMDLILAFPAILLAIFIVAVMGPGIGNAMVAIAIVRVPQMARVTRAQVLSLKEKEYVEAARALGHKNLMILFKHILLNGFAPMLVIATLGMGTAIVTEAGLSFLGLGAQPPAVSWGRMLNAGREVLRTSPHVATYPGIAIAITVLGFNLLGDGMRDVFDPRFKR